MGLVRTALVTGGNRGLGLESCRQLLARGHQVILCSRDPVAGHKAVQELTPDGQTAVAEPLDVSQPQSIALLLERLRAQGRHVDVLINNAGVCAEGDALHIRPADMDEAMNVHVLGAWRLLQGLLPGMVKRRWGRVVNVSSGWGSFSEGLDGPAAYSVSKAALNALTVVCARSVPPSVKVNAACPGWVRTRMGGQDAELSVEEGADTVMWLATLPDDGPTGGFFRQRAAIPW